MATMTIDVSGNPIIPCGNNINATGNLGIYEMIYNVGTSLGYTGIKYNSFGIPDRFQIYYNGALVADSKFVGNTITNINPNGGVTLGPINLTNYTYNGSTFDNTGTFTNLDIQIPDFANNTTEPTINLGLLLFEKTTANPSTIRIVVTGGPYPSSTTSWEIEGICPTNPDVFIDGEEKIVHMFFTEPNKGNQTKSSKFVLGTSPVKFYTTLLGDTNFADYGYTPSLQYINDTVNWWRIDATGNILDTGTL